MQERQSLTKHLELINLVWTLPAPPQSPLHARRRRPAPQARQRRGKLPLSSTEIASPREPRVPYMSAAASAARAEAPASATRRRAARRSRESPDPGGGPVLVAASALPLTAAAPVWRPAAAAAGTRKEGAASVSCHAPAVSASLPAAGILRPGSAIRQLPPTSSHFSGSATGAATSSRL